ncbi:MAG TPA: FAD-dependent oxidoreductase, partial [Bacillales bacterium]|nr:FAD-dependent oxidoreductase [Bacillales bacterium]
PEFESLKEDLETEVAVVGGGITGITAAYLLAQEGVEVTLLEADRLLNGVTGHTTAKVTAQHELIYDELIRHMGRSKAKLYYEANSEAIEFIRNQVKEENIDCDFSDQDAFVYATTEKSMSKLMKEWDAYKKLGIAGDVVDDVPFTKVKKALIMKNQAQFHPVRYLAHMLRVLKDKGVRIYEKTQAVNVDHGEKPTVQTIGGQRVTAKHILSCSHYPFYDGLGFYYTRMYASRSYIVAVKSNKPFEGGMYISADNPVRSLRAANMDGEELILIGGESHKTGQGEDTLLHYEALESFGRQVFGDIEVKYRWSAQDLETLDKVPYIGRITSGESSIFVATGYKKWGMTSGTVAAMLLRDHVLGRKNRYSQLFSPSRFYADPSLKQFLIQNADVAKHLIRGKFEMPVKDPETLEKDEGQILVYRGQRAGAYKDTDGKLHILDTTCTHMGCEVEWNHGDRTWDCPCHGSRYSYKGEVIEGPAEKPLEYLNEMP